VNRSKRVICTWSLVLSLALLLISGCILKPGSTGKPKETPKPSKGTPSIKPGHVDASIFPTFGVSGDSCYVYLKPTRRSENFGPLKKGEQVKRIDTQGQWYHVWIPRLRTSGWVTKNKVYKAKQKTPTYEGIPLDLLDTVTVISSRANIRSGPNTSASKIHLAKRKERFVILGARDGWYQIWVSPLKKKGWIYGKIVTRTPKK